MRYATIAAAVAMLAATSVEAAPTEPCVPVAQLNNYLMMRYGEYRIGTRPGTFPYRLWLFASKSGTWTVVKVNGSEACIIEAGRDWSVPTKIHGNHA